MHFSCRCSGSIALLESSQLPRYSVKCLESALRSVAAQKADGMDAHEKVSPYLEYTTALYPRRNKAGACLSHPSKSCQYVIFLAFIIVVNAIMGINCTGALYYSALSMCIPEAIILISQRCLSSSTDISTPSSNTLLLQAQAKQLSAVANCFPVLLSHEGPCIATQSEAAQLASLARRLTEINAAVPRQGEATASGFEKQIDDLHLSEEATAEGENQRCSTQNPCSVRN